MICTVRKCGKFLSQLLGGLGRISSTVKRRTKKERRRGNSAEEGREFDCVTYWIQYEQEGIKKKGKNICRESSEYHADTSR